MDVLIVLKSLPVIYREKRYLLLEQYASGFCEVVEEREPYSKVELVHFSESGLCTDWAYQ